MFLEQNFYSQTGCDKDPQPSPNLDLFTRGDDICGLSEELIEQILSDISPFLKPRKSHPRYPKVNTHRKKILCALSFFAKGGYQYILSKVLHGLSQSATSKSINEIASVLSHPVLVKKYIRFPQTALERQELKDRFYEKFKIPGVIGSIGGTFVKYKFRSPFSRKGTHVRNIQLIVDADLNILHVDASYGDASHDSCVFEKNERVYFLGDSDHVQSPYMMTPITDAEDNSPESYYNKLHATALNSVERTISVLKGRFRCLLVHRVLNYHPDVVTKIIIACCVLHNICNRAGLPAIELNQEDLKIERSFVRDVRQQAAEQHSQGEVTAAGRLARTELVQELWRGLN